MPDSTPSIETQLLTEAIAFIRQEMFRLKNPASIMTPRQIEEHRADVEDWLEKAGRWAKNKPEMQTASRQPAFSQPCAD